MRKIFRKIFRYKLTSIFFIIGQLIIYITMFTTGHMIKKKTV